MNPRVLLQVDDSCETHLFTYKKVTSSRPIPEVPRVRVNRDLGHSSLPKLGDAGDYNAIRIEDTFKCLEGLFVPREGFGAAFFRYRRSVINSSVCKQTLFLRKAEAQQHVPLSISR